MLRWTDIDNTGNDHGLAIDDLRSQVITSGDLAPTVSSTTPANGATGVALAADITINFSEAVNVTDPWFSISCTLSGAHTAAVSGGPTSFTLNPAADFVNDETCTVTVTAASVSDQDAIDPPDTMAADYTFSFATPTSVCGAGATPISSVQGSGASSPLAGSMVTVKGIVTGDFQSISGGFYLQSLPAEVDANPLTSEGLYVYNNAISASVGDVLYLQGAVSEYNGLTELGSVSLLNTCATGQSLPAAVVLDLPDAANPTFSLEPYEGMLVTIPETLTVQQNYFQGRYGQVTLGAGGRIPQMHNFTKNGGSLYEYTRMIVLDDGSSSQNRNPIPYYAADGALRAGDTVTGLTGVLDQGLINSTSGTVFPYDYYRLNPTVAPVFSQANPRPAVAPAVGGRLLISGANVENYFTTLDNGSYPGGSPYGGSNTPRGANSAAEFTRQQAKIVATLAGVHADVFGLTEIESWNGANGGLGAGQALVDALNAVVGAGTYAVVADPASGYFDPTAGGDYIQTEIIYDTHTVAPVGAALSSNDTIFSRSPFAQEFRELATGETFVVVVNHFKSKGSCPASGLDADQGDGQGCWNALRVQQAQALLSFINTSLVPLDPDVILVGDYNAYGAEDPINTLTAGGLVNQMAAHVPAAERYSYVFDGTSGYLDHGLSTASANAQITGAAFWHINSDEPSVIDYNTEFKGGSYSPDLYTPAAYRSSDHDPVLIGLSLIPTAPGTFEIPGRTSGADVQSILSLAPAGSTIRFLGTPGPLSGGFSINTPPLTIVLNNGTVIQNNSPCFVVNADYVTITTQSIGGARCVPTNGDSGIVVNGVRTNIIIEGIEFDGSGQTTANGILFNDAITDVQVVDNFFHNLGGSGLVFNGAVTNNQGIQGNLFKDLGAAAIVTGTQLNAEYNSWGAYTGAGTLTNVDSTPWTHVDLGLVSSGTPWANQVFTGGTITYSLTANLQNVMGADFRLVYDPARLSVASAAAGTYFTNPAHAGATSPLDTSTPGVISFAGYANTPVSGQDLVLYTVTFNALAAGSAALNLDEATDAFAMFPGYGPSTFVYASALLDGAVNVIGGPTLSAVNLAGPFLTGQMNMFSIRLQNPANGGSYTNVLVNFLIENASPADLTSLEYWDTTTSSWLPLPLTQSGANLVGSFGPPSGFPIGAGYDATSQFRVVWAHGGSYPITLTLVDLSPNPDAVLATLHQTAEVYVQPTLTSTLDGAYLAGIPETFTLTVNNPDLVHTYNNVYIGINNSTWPAGTLLEYWNGSTWVTVSGSLTLGSLPPGTRDLPMRITFSQAGSGNAVFDLVETDPFVWPLYRLTVPVNIYANITVTGTISMQGRTVRDGVVMTLTGPVLFPFGPYSATSINQISNNLGWLNVAAGSYLVTTTQARYLDVTTALGINKLITTTPTALAALELKGGDANDDNIVELGDASIIAGQYGLSGVEHNGDVNFSGKVDIFDLVLVGGNYLLTSAAAYGAWLP